MKTLLLCLSAALALFVSPPSARAADTWECQLKGDIAGVRLGFIIGGQVLKGDGVITCKEAGGAGLLVDQPVSLAVVGGGVGFDFTIVRSLRVISAGVGDLQGPELFTGSFNMGATAGATLINQGISVDSAVKLTRDDGFGFEMGFTGEDAVGLGVRLHGLVFKITPR